MIVRLFLDLHFVCFTFLAYELSGSLINLPYNCLKIIFLSVINLLFDLIILRSTKALKPGPSCSEGVHVGCHYSHRDFSSVGIISISIILITVIIISPLFLLLPFVLFILSLLIPSSSFSSFFFFHILFYVNFFVCLCCAGQWIQPLTSAGLIDWKWGNRVQVSCWT